MYQQRIVRILKVVQNATRKMALNIVPLVVHSILESRIYMIVE